MRAEVAREKARALMADEDGPTLERARGAKAETDVERKTAESMAVVFILEYNKK